MTYRNSSFSVRVATAGVALAFLPLLQAQQSPMEGPTQGFVYDGPSGSVRQLIGSFGSASLGPVLLNDLAFASLAPQRSYGIGCSSGQCFLITGLGTGSVEQQPLADQFGMPDAAVWSADGTVVAIYSRSDQWIRVIRNLPGTADPAPQWSIASLGGQLSKVAISPDGKRVWMGLAGDHPGVFEITPEGNFIPVNPAENPVAFAFSANGETLYVLDAGSHQITEIHLPDGLAQSWPIEGVENPVGLQLGRDSSGRNVIYVAGGSDHTLFVYGSDHQVTEQVPLSFAPSQIELSGSGSLLLTTRRSSDDVLWSYTAGRGAYFVPVTPAAPEVTNGPNRRVRR